jgi:hypothetical protein
MTDNADEDSLESIGASSTEQSPSVEHETNSAISSLVAHHSHATASANSNAENEDALRSRRRSSVSIIHSIVTTSHLLTTIEARRR